MNMPKIHVLLRDLGVASRRASEELIAEGRVTVDGKTAHIGQQVDGTEVIMVDGKQISSIQRTQASLKRYFLVNKPIGVTSTTKDKFAESSVLDLLPENVIKSGLWQIAGRLDKLSEGLVLITNDGEVVYKLTHPKFEIPKKYEVVVSRSLNENELASLREGIVGRLGEEYHFLDIVEISTNTYRITLIEGKKREIREAMRALEVEVLSLIRTDLGPFRLSQLENKPYRELTPSEVIELRKFLAD